MLEWEILLLHQLWIFPEEKKGHELPFWGIEAED